MYRCTIGGLLIEGVDETSGEEQLDFAELDSGQRPDEDSSQSIDLDIR